MFGQRGNISKGMIHSLMTAADFKGFNGEALKKVRGKFEEKVRDNLDWVVTGVPTVIKNKGVDEEVWSPFSQAGDSGALVYTNTNENDRVVVGMVRGGADPLPYWTFVIPIEFIYQDILAKTGAEDIRLMV